MTSAVSRIAEFAAGLTAADIPRAVRAIAVSCLIDTIGVAIAGSRHPVVRRLAELAQATYAPGACTLVGSRATLSAPGAALVNGAAAHALDFDDNCYAGFVHGSAVIAPALLAAAEACDASGAAFLAAFVAGCEAEFTVGAAATPHIYEKGWWTTGVLGPVGGAVAAAKVMGADAAAISDAIGLAVAGTGGLKACFGTDGKPALCGRAAEAGVICALMAKAGLSGPHRVFEDARGFARLFNDGIFETAGVERLGSSWYLLDPGIDIKRVPICLSSHAALDAVLDLMAEHRIVASDVERVVCDVGPVVVANLVYPEPRTPQEAQFSMPFAIACALVHGDVTLPHLHADVLRGQALREMMGRVSMISTGRWSDPRLSGRWSEGAHVSLLTRDGRTLERFTDTARGTAPRPLSEEEIARKFRACAGPEIGSAETERLISALRSLDGLASIRTLFAPPL